MKIGIIPLSTKPLPSPNDSVFAPGNAINNLINGLINKKHTVTVFTGSESVCKGTIISGNLKTPWNTYGPPEKDLTAYTERRIEYDLIQSVEAIHEFTKKNNLDIINSHDFRINPYIFSLTTIPIIYTPHTNLSNNLSPYDLHRYKIIKKMNSGITALSKNNVLKAEEVNLPCFGYTPNGIDTTQFKPGRTHKSGVLIVNRIVPGKCIIEALEGALLSKEKITLIGPVGPKEEDKKYFSLIQKRFLHNPRIVYKGYLTPDKIIPYYQKARLLLYLSNSEGLPLGILEALACETPVIGSNVGGIPDIIEHGKNGYIIHNNKSKDEIYDAIQNIYLIHNQACRDKIEKEFSISAMVDNYINAYSQFLTYRNRDKI